MAVHAYSDCDLSRYVVKVSGKHIPETYAVVGIEVRSELNRIPRAVVELVDGDPAEGTFAIVDAGAFVPGAPLSIELGYHDQSSEVFRGVVTSQSVRSNGRRGGVLVVEALHRVFRATTGRKNAVYSQKKDAAVVAELLEATGVKAAVDIRGPTLPQLVQYYATDWDFILARAEANGCVVRSAPKDVTVSAPATRSSVLTLQYGHDVLDFELELDAVSQVDKVVCTAWSYEDQELMSVESNVAGLNKVGAYDTVALANAVGSQRWAMQSSADLAHADLQAWANAEYTRRAFAKIQGMVRLRGTELVQPGDTVTLKGFGKTFDGAAFVGAVKHLLDADGTWQTEVHLGLNDATFSTRTSAAAPLASGLVPGSHGLMNGVVTAVVGDPSHSCRIQVEVPLLGSGESRIWARLASFYASHEIGALFVPELGDEVVIGFLNSDPASAIVLGSLYSGSKIIPPWQNDEPNSQKGIVTKQKLALRFDETGPAIRIETPGGRKFSLDDQTGSALLEDGFGNQVRMTEAGIEIKTSKTLTLSAGQGIALSTSSGDVSVSSTAGGAKVSAREVEITGNQTLKASGTLSTTLESAGPTVVKGLVVKIN